MLKNKVIKNEIKVNVDEVLKNSLQPYPAYNSQLT